MRLFRSIGVYVASACGLVAFAAQALADGPDPADFRKTRLGIKSALALVVDQDSGEVFYSKHDNEVASIASITKLMTAIVILDSGVPLLDKITIDRKDIDRYKGSFSKLSVGTELTRAEALKLALMASE